MNILWIVFALLMVAILIAAGQIVAVSSSFVGCFQQHELNNTDIQHPSVKKKQTVTQCITMCGNNYYRYAGIAANGECWCHNNLGLNINTKVCDNICFDNSTLICGSKNDLDILRFSVYHTIVNGPSRPKNISLQYITENSVHVSWSPPEFSNDIVQYQVTAQVIHTYATTQELYPHQWTFSNNTFHNEIGGLQPGTQYNVSVKAITKEQVNVPLLRSEESPASYAIFETLISVPDLAPSIPQLVSRIGNKMTIKLMPAINNNGPITWYRLVVINLDQMQVFQPDLLEPYHEAQTNGLSYYIAAQLNPEDVKTSGLDFVLGDGKDYGGYYNAPLYEGAKYRVLIGIVSTSGLTRIRYSEMTNSDSNMVNEIVSDVDTLVVVLSVAVVLAAVLLLLAAAALVLLRRRYHRGRRQRLSDNQELSVQGPVIQVLNHGYVPDEELDPQVSHYDKLKKIVWHIPRDCLKFDSSRVLGFGKFGHVLGGTVRSNENADIAVAVHVVTDGDMSVDQRRSMLRELDILIKAGHHEHLACLVGTCETADTVLIACQYHSLLLKDMLLSSRIQFQNNTFTTRFTNISENQILDLAVGIVEGMNHLAQNNLTHEKLCAKNVIIFDNSVPKLTGYGLSHFNRDNIVLNFMRWTAVEVLKGKPVSVKSDVWSFGCCLWELCSLGGTPYHDLTDCKSVSYEITRGHRLPQPDYFGDELYQLMLDCWQEDPDERPTFQYILDQLQYFKLSLSLKAHLSFNLYSGFHFSKYFPDLEITEECIL